MKDVNHFNEENEEMKRKLEDEFEANFWVNPDIEGGLPAEMENEFLNQIMAFENASENAKTITVYEFIQKPVFKPVHEIADNEISEELNKLLEYLNGYQICLDTLCEVDDRELYRFITEELFMEDKSDMHIPGMISHYTYEEFHPNHEYDLRRYTIDFISSFLDKNSDFYTHELSSEAPCLEWLNHFRASFSAFEIIAVEIISISFDIDNAVAKVDFDCDFNASVEGENDVFKFNGKGALNFEYKWDFWYINDVSFPKNKLMKT